MSKAPVPSKEAVASREAARLAALHLLAECEPSRRGAAWAEALAASTDPAREVRAASAEAVAALGAPIDALPVLSRLIDDDDVGVRHAAVGATCALPWRGRLELLVTALGDEDLGVRAVAADGLAHARDVRAAQVLRELLSVKRLRFDALEGLLVLRDEALETLAPKLAGGLFTPPFERAMGELVLARRGDAGALKAFRGRLSKKRAEERPFVLIHLATLDDAEGRRLVEAVAADKDDYLRESAILALARIDASYWARGQEAVGRWSDEDPHVAGELLLGLFEVDWKRASLVADAHVRRDGELGSAARRVRLQAVLRDEHASELLPPCA